MMRSVKQYHLEEAEREVEHIHALTEAFLKRVRMHLKQHPDLIEEALPLAARLGKDADLLEEAIRLLYRFIR